MKFYFFSLGSQNSKFPRQREKKRQRIHDWSLGLASFFRILSLFLSPPFFLPLFSFLSFSEINTSKYVLVSICFYGGKYFIT